jgi:hypothetical protein
MASKQTEELNKLYLEWVAALKANPEMPLDEPMNCATCSISGRGSLANRAASITSKPMPEGFRPCGRRRRAACKTAYCWAPLKFGPMSPTAMAALLSTERSLAPRRDGGADLIAIGRSKVLPGGKLLVQRGDLV